MKVIKRGEIVESTFERTKGHPLEIVKVFEIRKEDKLKNRKNGLHHTPKGIIYTCYVNGNKNRTVNYHEMFIKEYDNTKYENYPYIEDNHTSNKNDWGF